MMSIFKKKEELDLSPEKSQKLKEQYPKKIPVVVTSVKEIELKKRKYLVDENITCGQLLCIFRSKIHNLSPSESLYMFINENNPILAPAGKELYLIFDEHNEDGYMKIALAKESTFG